jgi:hypothetical protein
VNYKVLGGGYDAGAARLGHYIGGRGYSIYGLPGGYLGWEYGFGFGFGLI